MHLNEIYATTRARLARGKRVTIQSCVKYVVIAFAFIAMQQNTVPAQMNATSRLMGFTEASSKKQLEVEDKMKALISSESARNFHRFFTSEPHPAGTEENRKVAEYIADAWRKQ